MTVFTSDVEPCGRLVVKNSVAVGGLAEVTIDAMHAAFGVDVVEMHRLAEFCWIVRRDDVAVRVEQVSLAIAFENFAKHPTMAMKVCELRVAQQRIERRLSW